MSLIRWVYLPEVDEMLYSDLKKVFPKSIITVLVAACFLLMSAGINAVGDPDNVPAGEDQQTSSGYGAGELSERENIAKAWIDNRNTVLENVSTSGETEGSDDSSALPEPSSVIEYTDDDGNVIRKDYYYVDDDSGDTIVYVREDFDTDGDIRTMSLYVYDEEGRTTTYIYATFDEDGRAIRSDEYNYSSWNPDGNVLTATCTKRDRDGNIAGYDEYTYEYDPETGQLKRLFTLEKNSEGVVKKEKEHGYDDSGLVEYYFYRNLDKAGNVKGSVEYYYGQRDANGKVLTYIRIQKSSSGRIIRYGEHVYNYDPVTGRKIWIRLTERKVPGGKIRRILEYQYDDDGKKYRDVVVNFNSAGNYVSEYEIIYSERDSEGRLLRSKRTEKNRYGNIRRTYDYAYEYGSDGKRMVMYSLEKTGNGKPIVAYKYDYEYGQDGKLKKVIQTQVDVNDPSKTIDPPAKFLIEMFNFKIVKVTPEEGTVPEKDIPEADRDALLRLVKGDTDDEIPYEGEANANYIPEEMPDTEGVEVEYSGGGKGPLMAFFSKWKAAGIKTMNRGPERTSLVDIIDEYFYMADQLVYAEGYSVRKEERNFMHVLFPKEEITEKEDTASKRRELLRDLIDPQYVKGVMHGAPTANRRGKETFRK